MRKIGHDFYRDQEGTIQGRDLREERERGNDVNIF